MKKPKIFICIFVIICVLGVIFYNIKYNRYYVKDYYNVLSLKSSSSYKDIVSVYGEPTETEKLTNNINNTSYCEYRLKYADFTFSLTGTEKDGAENARKNKYCIITSDKSRFGPAKIGVGSSKADVRTAYSKCKKAHYISADSNENTDVYYDNGYHVSYCYKNDVVNEILFYLYLY